MKELAGPRDVSSLQVVAYAEEVRQLQVQFIELLLEPLAAAQPDLDSAKVELPPIGEAADKIARRAARLAARAYGFGTGPLVVHRADLQHEAAVELARGVRRPDRVLLLVRCLPVAAGLRALARCLHALDFIAEWGDLTLEQVIGALQDADHHFVRRLIARAFVSPGAEWNRCRHDDLVRLAAVLDEHGERAERGRCR